MDKSIFKLFSREKDRKPYRIRIPHRRIWDGTRIKPLRHHLFRFLVTSLISSVFKNVALLVPFWFIFPIKHHRSFLGESIWADRDSGFFSKFAACSFVDGFIFFYFSTWPAPLPFAETSLFHTQKYASSRIKNIYKRGDSGDRSIHRKKTASKKDS